MKLLLSRKRLTRAVTSPHKVVSDAYEGFQAAFPAKADQLLHAWAQINILDCEKSVGQRANNFRKQRDQFQTLVSFFLFICSSSCLVD